MQPAFNIHTTFERSLGNARTRSLGANDNERSRTANGEDFHVRYVQA
jgi:hypothetical protein